MGKAAIKVEVFRANFAGAATAVVKAADESRNNFVPADAGDALAGVRYVVSDAGIGLHGYDNLVRADPHDVDAGYRTTGATGAQLAGYVLAPVRRAFRELPGCETFVLAMDKACFMPRPKVYTQTGRTSSLVDALEQRNIEPIETPADGSMPTLVAADLELPPWMAVRANRTLYRHATAQLFDLIVATYRPPAGCRLIIDCLDTAATSPESLDAWMRTERVVCDAYARSVIERARRLLRGAANWRTEARRIVAQLGHGGHVRSVPICIETSADGHTYAPFLLRNAANVCGEADVGVLFWLNALQARRQHVTLDGERLVARALDAADAEFYTDEQLAGHAALADERGAPPEPFVERCRAAQALLDAIDAARDDVEANQSRVDGDAARLGARSERARRAATLVGAHRSAPPDQVPCRGLVLSSDTDFLALLTLWYAWLTATANGARTADEGPGYAYFNAPLLSIGQCEVLRTGRLGSAADYYVRPPAAKRRRDEEERAEMSPEQRAALPPAPVPIKAHEVWDIARLWALVKSRMELALDECGAPADDDDETIDEPTHAMNLAASFAAFCASCENDYLAGLPFVNRRCMFDALLALDGPLAHYDADSGVGVLSPGRYATYIKHCYHRALTTAHGKANKPPRPAAQMSYVEMAAAVAKKYKITTKTGPQKQMPSADRLKLMYERTQWWLVYALCAWRDITELLDDTQWGWPPGSTDVWV